MLAYITPSPTFAANQSVLLAGWGSLRLQRVLIWKTYLYDIAELVNDTLLKLWKKVNNRYFHPTQI